MYPVLLDDHALFTEFEIFIEAVDKIHELALAGDQQFPVIHMKLIYTLFYILYSLFFVLKSEADFARVSLHCYFLIEKCVVLVADWQNLWES